jgi:hypothetical protein
MAPFFLYLSIDEDLLAAIGSRSETFGVMKITACGVGHPLIDDQEYLVYYRIIPTNIWIHDLSASGLRVRLKREVDIFLPASALGREVDISRCFCSAPCCRSQVPGHAPVRCLRGNEDSTRWEKQPCAVKLHCCYRGLKRPHRSISGERGKGLVERGSAPRSGRLDCWCTFILVRSPRAYSIFRGARGRQR